MLDFEKYFIGQHQFRLEQISYNIVKEGELAEGYTLNCSDKIDVQVVDDEKIKIIVTRSLNFVPESLFALTIAFGATLSFNQEYKNEIQWDEINLAEEVQKNGQNILNNLVSRISLQISQITSCVGQPPIITPPSVTGR